MTFPNNNVSSQYFLQCNFRDSVWHRRETVCGKIVDKAAIKTQTSGWACKKGEKMSQVPRQRGVWQLEGGKQANRVGFGGIGIKHY